LGIDLIEWMNPSMPDPKQPALRPFAEFMHRAARYNSALPHKGLLDLLSSITCTLKHVITSSQATADCGA
jgi:hypothetical protein